VSIYKLTFEISKQTKDALLIRDGCEALTNLGELDENKKVLYNMGAAKTAAEWTWWKWGWGKQLLMR